MIREPLKISVSITNKLVHHPVRTVWYGQQGLTDRLVGFPKSLPRHDHEMHKKSPSGTLASLSAVPETPFFAGRPAWNDTDYQLQVWFSTPLAACNPGFETVLRDLTVRFHNFNLNIPAGTRTFSTLTVTFYLLVLRSSTLVNSVIAMEFTCFGIPQEPEDSLQYLRLYVVSFPLLICAIRSALTCSGHHLLHTKPSTSLCSP